MLSLLGGFWANFFADGMHSLTGRFRPTLDTATGSINANLDAMPRRFGTAPHYPSGGLGTALDAATGRLDTSFDTVCRRLRTILDGATGLVQRTFFGLHAQANGKATQNEHSLHGDFPNL